jgi:hypothetical protein
MKLALLRSLRKNKMEATKSYIKVHDISPQVAEDFEYDYTVDGCDPCSDLSVMLVPDRRDWGNLEWGVHDADEYEYSSADNVINFTLETKWAAPIDWLKAASRGTPYFQNKLMTMTTIQKDETCVTGVAVLDGDVLQNKTIWSMDSEEVGKYYCNDEGEDYDLDELDNQIWDSIGKFLNVCEQFYLEREENND